MLRPDDLEIGSHELLDEAGSVLARFDIADRKDWMQADVTWTDSDSTAAEVATSLATHLVGLRVATTDGALAAALIHAGGSVARQGTQMEYDAAASPPPAAWLDRAPRAGISLVDYRPVDHEIAAGWLAAYPPTHPDHDPALTTLDAAVDDLGSAQREGSFLGVASALAVDAHGAVLGGITVMAIRPSPLWHGPWVSDVFVVPAAQGRGIGERLVRYAVAAIATAGHAGLALSVTEGNPARRVYERVGFRPTWTFTSVALPSPPLPHLPNR